MNMKTPGLAALLLATTALAAPSAAFAQNEPPPPAQEEPVEVGEILVLGRFIPDEMRETSEVSSFLTVEDLARQGDGNAAEALTRVTGLSLVEGKFVYVRGLGERYSAALLNGSPLPSPEPLQRVVPLDLFPTSILAGAMVQKTFSPQFPGEFGGGVIDLRTVGVPDDPFLSMGVSAGFETRTTMREGLTYYGSDTDFLGFDDGVRDMPGLLADAIATGRRVETGTNFTAAQIQAIGQSFENASINLLQRDDNIPGDFSFGLSAGDSFDLAGGGVLGVVATGSFESKWTTREGVQQSGRTVNGVISPNEYDFGFESTQNDVTSSALVGLTLELNPDHEFKWTNLYIRKTSKEARSREGDDPITSGGVSRTDYTEWFERELFNTQLAGEHHFDPLKVSWRAAYAQTSREAPYERQIRYSNVGGVYSVVLGGSNTRFSDLFDELLSAGIDFEYTLPLSSVRDAVLSAGYAYFDNDRRSTARDFRFVPATGSIDPAILRERPDFLFADYNIGPTGLALQEVTAPFGGSAYRAGLKVKGFYGQIDAEVVPLVRVAVGARREDGTQFVDLVPLFGEGATNFPANNEKYWLPAATVTWNFFEDMQVRLGASKTIARPQFRELAPQQYIDPDSDRIFFGNRFLVDSELTNIDARYEFYFSGDEYLTAGVFWKSIENPIESVVGEISSGVIGQTFVNAPKAVLKGAEFEIKRYWDIPTGIGWLDSKRWLTAANYTYTDSKVQVEPGDMLYAPQTTVPRLDPARLYIDDGDRMQGQSDHVVNLQFGFSDEAAGSQATLLLNYVSERISARGRTNDPDLIEKPGVKLDFTYRKDLLAWGHELEFGIEARNLLGTDYEESQEIGASRIVNYGYDVGQRVSFSLSARF